MSVGCVMNIKQSKNQEFMMLSNISSLFPPSKKSKYKKDLELRKEAKKMAQLFKKFESAFVDRFDKKNFIKFDEKYCYRFLKEQVKSQKQHEKWLKKQAKLDKKRASQKSSYSSGWNTDAPAGGNSYGACYDREGQRIYSSEEEKHSHALEILKTPISRPSGIGGRD